MHLTESNPYTCTNDSYIQFFVFVFNIYKSFKGIRSFNKKCITHACFPNLIDFFFNKDMLNRIINLSPVILIQELVRRHSAIAALIAGVVECNLEIPQQSGIYSKFVLKSTGCSWPFLNICLFTSLRRRVLHKIYMGKC